MQLVVVEEINAEKFAPYGDVFEHQNIQEANHGTAYRQNWHTAIQSVKRPKLTQVDLNVCTFNCSHRKLPLNLELLERHYYSSQLFQPLSHSDYLTVVGLNSVNGPTDIKAFRVQNQAINYKPGIWHHPMINLQHSNKVFLCLVNEQRDGQGGNDDCEEVAVQLRVAEKMIKVAEGKVRSLYSCDDEYLLVVTSDRMSAYDVILKSTIPQKACILTELTKFWFDYLESIGLLQKPNAQTGGVRHHLVSTDICQMPLEYQQFIEENQISSKSVMLVKKLKVVAIEAIVRGYLAGSAYNEYLAGGGGLPKGLQEGSKLPEPIFTPSTKAEYGQHDQNISFEQMKDLLNNDNLAEQIKLTSLQIYETAAAFALQKGIIIADTKLEFGTDQDGSLYVVDEILTPDSSRFWPLSQWQPGQSQPSFDKQYVRDYLTSIKFDKKTPIDLPQDIISKTALKYQQVLDLLKK